MVRIGLDLENGTMSYSDVDFLLICIITCMNYGSRGVRQIFVLDAAVSSCATAEMTLRLCNWSEIIPGTGGEK